MHFVYSVAMNEAKVDIRTLAGLARLEISDAEIQQLQQEISSILGFVETIQRADVRVQPSTNAGLQNVMRVDANPHQGGVYTNMLLDQAPAREGDRLAVKQVISRKK